MSDMYIDVDAAVAIVVNKVPLIDDTDFKTREVAIAYNQAGMDLVWNFTTSAGVVTQTAVTPTTAGVHDWTHVGDGIYKLEIPASAGTINNDTEGSGFFSGICTGVLAWVSPIYVFRAAGLNNVLIDDAYSATRGLSGTALPSAAADAAGGLPISDAGGLDLDNEANTAFFTTPATLVDLVWDEVLTGGTHNVADSSGRRLRDLQEFGWYEGGAVFIDTIGGSAGTTDYESGASLNPVDTIADANTIATSLSLSRFAIAPGSNITFAASQETQSFFGDRWTLALGGQSISASHIAGADVSGICTGATAPEFHACHIGTCTLPAARIHHSDITGTITLGTGQIDFHTCSSENGATLDFGAAVANTTVIWTDFSGDITIDNLGASGTDILNIRGHGKITLNASCVGGTIKWDGHFTITDNSTVSPTITGDDISADVDALIVEMGTATGEPGQEAPGVSVKRGVKIDYLYKAFRNKGTQTATEQKIFADDGSTVDQKATVSDDATTYTKGEFGTGP